MKGNDQRCCKGWSCQGALDNSSFGSCASSLALDTHEAMSASSRVAQDADDAVSESSWIGLANWKERGWWSINLEGEMEKLEVVGPLSRTEGGSVDPSGKMSHRSDPTNVTKEEKEELKEAEMEVDGAMPQEANAEIPHQKKKR